MVGVPARPAGRHVYLPFSTTCHRPPVFLTLMTEAPCGASSISVCFLVVASAAARPAGRPGHIWPAIVCSWFTNSSPFSLLFDPIGSGR